MDTNQTKLRGYTVSYTNEKEYHIVKNEIYNSGIYDFQIENPYPLIIDCGAHIGLSVLYFKEQFPKSIIYALEPNPDTFKLLNENIFVNNLTDTHTYNLACDLKEGSKILHVDKTQEWFSTASYTQGSWTGNEPTYPIEVKVTDTKEFILNILKDTKRDSVDIIKMDIEGYEAKLVPHLQSILNQVNAFVMEYHPINRNSFNKIRSILQKYYKTIEYVQEGKTTKIPDINKLFVIRCRK